MTELTLEQLHELRAKGMRGDELKNDFIPGSRTVGRVEEWRVTGQPKPTARGHEFPPYDFRWYGENAEVKARCFLAQPEIESSFAHLKLHHRTVTYGEWQESNFIVDPEPRKEET